MTQPKATWTRVKGAKPVRGPEEKPKLKRVRAQSAKQVKLSREWQKLKATVLHLKPICQCCYQRKATEVHHKRGRGRFLLVVEYLMSVCHPCHDRIHRNPEWAFENGYMVSRLAKV